MRKLVVQEFLTLDGVMQAPGEKNKDTRGGFAHGGWQRDYFDDIFAKTVTEWFADAGGFVLGRKTYELFAAYWPTAPAEQRSVGDPLNNLPKYVASRTLKEPLEWKNSTVIAGDVGDAIRKLKKEPGKDLNVIGSGVLVQSLIADDVVDEYRLIFHPLVLGSGTRLFRDGVGRRGLELIDSAATTTGALIATYRPAGA